MMKIVKLLILLYVLPLFGYTQTYIAGKDVIPFTQIANSSYLTQDKRLTIDNAFHKLKEYETTSLDKMMGEYYYVNGFLIKIISGDLSVLKKMKYPGIYNKYLYFSGSYPEDRFYHKYEDLGKHKIYISYSKESNNLSFTLENNTYNISGSIYCNKNQLKEAQTFIDKFVRSITFKQ